MPNSKQIVYLSQAQYQELITNGTITVNGVTVTYNENDIYVTPQAEPVIDVRVNGTSIAANGVANIPVASASTFGVIKTNTSNGVSITNSGELKIEGASNNSEISNGQNLYKPIVPFTQHSATFYGLAKAAGDTTQSQSENTVGTYTVEAKTAIQTMLDVPAKSDIPEVPVTDVQIDGTSVLNGQGIADIPAASANVPGVVKVTSNSGIGFMQAMVNDQLITTSEIGIIPASNGQIKNQSGSYAPITADKTNRAVFYGLAKAAGDSTQSQSSNSIGTYTNEAKGAIQSMLGVSDLIATAENDLVASKAYAIGDIFTANGKLYKATAAITANAAIITDGANANCIECNISDNLSDKVAKAEIEYAGISKYTYSTKFGGEFSVTTTTTSGQLNPYARASVTGRINKENMHRVTFNGTEYILRTRLWYENNNSGFKVYEYLGNLGLYIESTAGVPGGTDNVPFIIISDLNNSSSIDVITQTAGTYTILVEQINPTKIDLPKSLIWGDSYVPIKKNNNGGTYNGFSIGVNELLNKRATFAFGYGNKISNEFSFALGLGNIVSGRNGIAIGDFNEITSGERGHAIGAYLICNKSNMTAIGYQNVEAKSHTEWEINTQYNIGDVVHTTPAPGFSVYLQCKEAHVSTNIMTDLSKWKISPSNGDTAFVIGNGNPKNSINRSNAMKVDWVGNIYLGGDAYVNANSDSTGGIKLATENIIAIQDTQPTGTDTKIWLPETAGTSIQVPTVEEMNTALAGKVGDVQVNGSSIVSNGIATIPIGNNSTLGVFRRGPGLYDQNGVIGVNSASDDNIKNATAGTYTMTSKQHMTTFYGLAKAAGDTTQAVSDNAVGQYTDSAKASIKSMLGIVDGSTGTVDVTGATPTITAVENTRYVCGEVTSLDLTPAASGICIVRFTSGSTVTVLTLPSTVKFPEWFDPATLETNTIYEICITDGIYGAVMSWAQ